VALHGKNDNTGMEKSDAVCHCNSGFARFDILSKINSIKAVF
jgi:hypothetical protein